MATVYISRIIVKNLLFLVELLASVIPTKSKSSGVFLILTGFGEKNIQIIDKPGIKHLGFEPGVLLYLKLHKVAARCHSY